MNEHRSAPGAATSGTLPFDERLSVPFWWYIPALGIALLLGAEIHLGYPGIRSWIGYAITVPVVVGALVWLGRTRVRVVDGRLHAGNAVLPLDRVGHVDVVAHADKQEALGPDLDPAAHLLHRPWIGPVVRIEVTGQAEDVTDATPYWVVSARDPDRLVAALGNRR